MKCKKCSRLCICIIFPYVIFLQARSVSFPVDREVLAGSDRTLSLEKSDAQTSEIACVSSVASFVGRHKSS